MVKNFTKKFLLYLLIISIVLPHLTYAGYLLEVRSVSISAVVVDQNAVPPGGGGGGGGISLPTTVNFSGMAYPLSKVYILKDGQVAAITIADPAANFSVSLSDLKNDTYNFSIYGEDDKGRKSSNFSFPIFITYGTIVNVGNIYLSPTIDIDKSEVKKGDNLIIFGQSVPKKEITISVHSDQEYFYKVTANNSGGYLYNLDTSILEIGNHQTKSKSTLNSGQITPYTNPVSFTVGLNNKINKITNCSLLRGDLNCDNHVNLIDFSIMAFWYKKTNPPTKVDLNSDRQISLIDFSIMAFNWTG